jgi:hypothetical protein
MVGRPGLALGAVAAVALVGPAAAGSRADAPQSRTCVLPAGAASLPAGVKYPFEVTVEPRSVAFDGSRGLLAVVSRTRAAVVPTCVATPSRRRVVSGLSGPWRTALRATVFCGTTSRNRLTFQSSQMRNKRRAVVGNQMIAAVGADVLVRASVTATGGNVWFNPTYCLRTASP